MSAERLQRIIHTLSHRQNDVTVLLDEVHKPHNLSAIIRTCDAVGVPEVHAIETADQELKTFRRATAGSERWVNLNIHPHSDKQSTIEKFKSEGKQVLAAQLSDKAVCYREINFTRPTALIMGAEKWGVSPEIADQVDQHIIVPMHGMVESLNVSVATALILFELERQRQAAGMYQNDCLDLDNPAIQKIIFEWMQPKMARMCREKDWEYPPLDQDGDILNPSEWYQQKQQQQQTESK
tara:strand:+ start:862 stop:1575 length:714 start_codon:yes stop_codon:yes gene_type:complete